MAEGRSRRGDNGQRDENQDNQRSREEALIQAQVDAQVSGKPRTNPSCLQHVGGWAFAGWGATQPASNGFGLFGLEDEACLPPHRNIGAACALYSPLSAPGPHHHAQNRHNQKALEQLGIADEWQQESGRSRGGKDDSEDSGKRSRGGKRGRRDDSDNEEQQDGGRGDRNQDEDNSDWSSGLSRKEKRRARKEAREAGMDVAEYMSQHGSGRKRGRGSRRSGSNWGADNPEVERRGRGRGGRGRGGVPATYHYYSPAYETSQLYCADAFRDTPGRQLLRRPWVSAVCQGCLVTAWGVAIPAYSSHCACAACHPVYQPPC